LGFFGYGINFRELYFFILKQINCYTPWPMLKEQEAQLWLDVSPN